MQRCAAVGTKLGMHLVRPEPLAARQTFRINAMNGPAR
jgi:hypothetical protein